MKRILGILVLGLFLSGNVHSEAVELDNKTSLYQMIDKEKTNFTYYS